MCYVQTSEWSDETKSRLRASKNSIKAMNNPLISFREHSNEKYLWNQLISHSHSAVARPRFVNLFIISILQRFIVRFLPPVSVFLSTISRNYLNEQKSSCLTFSSFPRAANEKSTWNRKSDTFNAFSICSQSLNLNIEIYCAWEWNFGKPFYLHSKLKFSNIFRLVIHIYFSRWNKIISRIKSIKLFREATIVM